MCSPQRCLIRRYQWFFLRFQGAQDKHHMTIIHIRKIQFHPKSKKKNTRANNNSMFNPFVVSIGSQTKNEGKETKQVNDDGWVHLLFQYWCDIETDPPNPFENHKVRVSQKNNLKNAHQRKLGHIFLFSKCLDFGEGKVPLGNMPSRYTRNYLPMLYKTFRASPLIPLFWASTNVYQMHHGGFIFPHPHL